MGRVAVDFYAEQVHSPLEDAQSFRKYLGGCAGNTAVGTSRLGLKSAMFSCVGADDTLIFYRENCADMQILPSDANPEIFKNAKALFITGTGLSTPSMREATRQAVKVAKESGCAVILDIDYRPVLWGLTDAGDGETRFVASKTVTQELQPFLAELDLIVGTEEEILIAGSESYETETLESCLAAIRKQSSATVVLKRGAEGCEVFSPESSTPISARSFFGCGRCVYERIFAGLVAERKSGNLRTLRKCLWSVGGYASRMFSGFAVFCRNRIFYQQL